MSKAIDRATGAVREIVARTKSGGFKRLMVHNAEDGFRPADYYPEGNVFTSTVPITSAAKQWDGWGSSLKPAHEPIVLARKPLSESSIAANVLRWGTGALNIDATRILSSREKIGPGSWSDPAKRRGVVGGDLGITRTPKDQFQAAQRQSVERANNLGRWPSNFILQHDGRCVRVGSQQVKGRTINRWDDGSKPFGGGAGHPYTSHVMGTDRVLIYACVPGCPIRMLDTQSGDRSSPRAGGNLNNPKHGQQHIKTSYGWGYERESVDYRDTGGASRFFYCSKASRRERNLGLDDLPLQKSADDGYGTIQRPKIDRVAPRENWIPHKTQNTHPTVKPLALMRYLCRLVTPPNGVVLDPFLGSGTTMIAARMEGFRVIGIEREAEYCKIALARYAGWRKQYENTT